MSRSSGSSHELVRGNAADASSGANDGDLGLWAALVGRIALRLGDLGIGGGSRGV
jgi:hypothetical protein